MPAEVMRTRRPAGPAPDGLRLLRPDDVPRRLRASRAARMDDEIPAQFKAGDEVVARNIHPMGHTRLPRYARGKRGVVDGDHGVFIYPDAHAAGLGKQPRSEEHTSELQSLRHLVCRLLLEKKN